MPRPKTSYLGNTQLKPAGIKTPFTVEQLEEWGRCHKDPEYFIEHYVKIVSLDHGIVPFRLRPYQRRMVRTVIGNRFSITKCPRQAGKSTTILAILLWLVNFRDEYSIGIFANKAKTAIKLLDDLKKMHMRLPKWLQQGVVEWNKTNIELENGSKVLAFSTTSDSGRSNSFNFVLLDEFAHVRSEAADAFLEAVYPTISSGANTQMAIVSTPNGFNTYYKLWEGANNPKDSTDPQLQWNGYAPFSIAWNDVPGRDEKWRLETIARIGMEKWKQEFECHFLGSAGTLIDPNMLGTIVPKPPISKKKLKFGGDTTFLDIYEKPTPNHTYLISADVADGKRQDYSAFTVIDISHLPYKVVAKYRSNLVKPIIYGDVIAEAGQYYNEAWLLPEINDLGRDVVRTLHQDLEYENILRTRTSGRKGPEVGAYGASAELGIRTNKATKRYGCSHLKTLIEARHLVFEDFHLFEEFTRFVDNGKGSFEAQKGEGNHDDLVMTLVNFAWMVNQPYFKDLTDTDIYAAIKREHDEAEDQDLMPVGVLPNDDPWGDDDGFVL